MQHTEQQARAITLADVVHKRQVQLINEKVDVDQRILALKAELLQMENRLAEIHLEYQVMENASELRQVVYTKETLTSTTHTGRKGSSDRLQFEDAVRKIFDLAGRPMGVTEIIGQLEKFGWQWSGYQPAYNYIKNSDIMEFAGKRGFYQLRQSRW